MRTLGTHKDLSVSPPSVSITILGDLEEKWVSFAIMLHPYLAQDKEDEEELLMGSRRVVSQQ